jgi:hypothetical protein
VTADQIAEQMIERNHWLASELTKLEEANQVALRSMRAKHETMARAEAELLKRQTRIDRLTLDRDHFRTALLRVRSQAMAAKGKPAQLAERTDKILQIINEACGSQSFIPSVWDEGSEQ